MQTVNPEDLPVSPILDPGEEALVNAFRVQMDDWHTDHMLFDADYVPAAPEWHPESISVDTDTPEPGAVARKAAVQLARGALQRPFPNENVHTALNHYLEVLSA